MEIRELIFKKTGAFNYSRVDGLLKSSKVMTILNNGEHTLLTPINSLLSEKKSTEPGLDVPDKFPDVPLCNMEYTMSAWHTGITWPCVADWQLQ